MDKYEYPSKDQLGRLEKKILDVNNDFLARHTQSAIELYACGDRDLAQIMAELGDNHMDGACVRW